MKSHFSILHSVMTATFHYYFLDSVLSNENEKKNTVFMENHMKSLQFTSTQNSRVPIALTMLMMLRNVVDNPCHCLILRTKFSRKNKTRCQCYLIFTSSLYSFYAENENNGTKNSLVASLQVQHCMLYALHSTSQ